MKAPIFPLLGQGGVARSAGVVRAFRQDPPALRATPLGRENQISQRRGGESFSPFQGGEIVKLIECLK